MALVKTLIRKLALAALLIVPLLWLAVQASRSDVVTNVVASFGYPGAFLVSAVSGFNLALPVSTVLFLPIFLAAGLKLLPLFIIIPLGMTIGDVVGYYLGRGGRTIADETYLETSAILARLEGFRNRHELLPPFILFLYVAFVPLPNELLAVPFGFLKYPARHVIPVLFIGNIVNTVLAFFVVLVAQQIF